MHLRQRAPEPLSQAERGLIERARRQGADWNACGAMVGRSGLDVQRHCDPALARAGLGAGFGISPDADAGPGRPDREREPKRPKPSLVTRTARLEAMLSKGRWVGAHQIAEAFNMAQNSAYSLLSDLRRTLPPTRKLTFKRGCGYRIVSVRAEGA